MNFKSIKYKTQFFPILLDFKKERKTENIVAFKDFHISKKIKDEI